MIRLLKIFFIVILGTVVLSAQSNKEIIDKAQRVSERLQQKLLLTVDQTAKIKQIVIDNFNQIKENKTNDVDTKVMSLLNEKQKEKFNIIRKDWLQPLLSH